MVYRIAATCFFVFTGLTVLGIVAVNSVLIGGAALVAGVALALGY